jgi:hypothetical protein
MLFGTNKSAYAQMAAAGIPLWSLRSYNAPAASVPPTFPGSGAMPLAPAPVVPIVSIKPSPAAVLGGQLDGALAAYFKAAPAGTFISPWHEGNLPASAFSGSPSQFVAMHAYIAAVARKANPAVKVCAIYGTYRVFTSGQNLSDWVCPGLAGYFLDGYQNSADHTPDVVFGQSWAEVLAVEPAARLGIAETNSTTDPAAWFPQAFMWAQAHGAIAFAPFFNAPGGGLPFNATDTAVITVLKQLSAEAAATP